MIRWCCSWSLWCLLCIFFSNVLDVLIHVFIRIYAIMLCCCFFSRASTFPEKISRWFLIFNFLDFQNETSHLPRHMSITVCVISCMSFTFDRGSTGISLPILYLLITVAQSLLTLPLRRWLHTIWPWSWNTFLSASVLSPTLVYSMSARFLIPCNRSTHDLISNPEAFRAFCGSLFHSGFVRILNLSICIMDSSSTFQNGHVVVVLYQNLSC